MSKIDLFLMCLNFFAVGSCMTICIDEFCSDKPGKARYSLFLFLFNLFAGLCTAFHLSNVTQVIAEVVK